VAKQDNPEAQPQPESAAAPAAPDAAPPAPARPEMGKMRAQAFSMLGEFVAWLRDLPRKARDLGQTNYELGLRFLADNEISDAKMRFQMALRFKPELYQAWYHLGACLREQGKTAEAISAFRNALRRKPDYEEARFMLTLTDANAPASAHPLTYPVPLVIRRFTEIAAEYDIRQQMKNYCAHISLYDALKPHLPEGTPLTVLDAGCGTGWMGVPLRPHVARLVGIDVTPAMAERAQLRYDTEENRVYDDIITDDLRAYTLRLQTPQYDLVTAADVMPYVGGLAAVFDGVARALKPAGGFAFTAEDWQGAGDYGLIRERERFGHREAYIRAQAERTGLEVVSIAPGKIIGLETGLICILQKPQ
jgi:predicted TPR repeat methyltransferase